MLQRFRRILYTEILILVLISIFTIAPVLFGNIIFGNLKETREIYFLLSLSTIIVFHFLIIFSAQSTRNFKSFFGGLACILVVSFVWLRGSDFLIFGFRDLFGYRGLFSSIAFAVAWPIANALAVLISGATGSAAK